MKTTRAMKLMLRPGSAGLVTMSLTGQLDEQTIERRRTLLGLTSLWVRPGPLRVALSADSAGSWAWSEDWTEALADVASGYELRFVLPGGHCRGGR
jgi:hypothetical protein